MLDQGYGLMPNKILFDRNLSDKEKLLFCLISSLCAEKWYCRATNEYMGEKLWVTYRTIREHVSKLQSKWYITVEIESNSKRTIRLRGEENFPEGGRNLPTRGEENFPQNNIINSIIEQDMVKFNEFWNRYPKKVQKKDTEKKFRSLSLEKQQLAIDALDKFKQTDQWKRWFVPNPTTYINQERRNDELELEQQKIWAIHRH